MICLFAFALHFQKNVTMGPVFVMPQTLSLDLLSFETVIAIQSKCVMKYLFYLSNILCDEN